MKKRRSLERFERRRNMLELNLISETKPRLAMPRRGCFANVTPVLGLVALIAFGLGLR